MFKINISRVNLANEVIFVYGEKSLLTELEERSILLNHNCRSGHCGACIALITNGQVQHNKSLYPLNDGEILICQARPLTDISIKI